MLNAMNEASEAHDYELAASYRDRIRALTSIQASQDINVSGVSNADVFVLAQKHGKSCVQVFFFRAGQNYGNRSYFPRHDPEESADVILSAFIAQFYDNKPVPNEIIVSHGVEDKQLLEEALSSKSKVKIILPSRGTRNRLLEFVRKNAEAALQRHLAESAGEQELLEKVVQLLNLESLPKRIEVYDNSHISGTNMVGAMIVAGPDGWRKNAYRKFNIKRAEAADDYGMMREVLSRRFSRALKENPDMDGESWPSIVIIDGGLGQFNAAREVLEEFGILNSFTLLAMSKGPDRNAGREKFITMNGSFELPPGDPVLHYFQRLRDEAHRFAISAHRAKRAKEIITSPLDEIPGVGPGRKKALLHHFGSAKAVADAGVEDLQKVEGISRSAAQKIYDHFH
jgi:excinuclease ABC subunit C